MDGWMNQYLSRIVNDIDNGLFPTSFLNIEPVVGFMSHSSPHFLNREIMNHACTDQPKRK